MSALLSIEVVSQPFERIAADLAVAGFFSDQRPLRGPASRVDWRLCGLISDLILRGRVSGRRGEAVLVPSQDRLYAPRVLLLGLGQRSKFSLRTARAATQEALDRALDLRVQRVVLPPLGVAADDFPRYAAVIMEGALDALAAEGRAEDRLWLRLVVGSSESREVAKALEAAAETRGVPQVDLELIDPSAAKPRKRAQSAQGPVPSGQI